jgi:predicted transcriptional regulator
MIKAPDAKDVLTLTTQIVAAHVGRNQLPFSELPKLIGEVFRSLNALGPASTTEPERPEPAVPIKKSVTADYIICLEDGRKLKMLKRHLKAAYGLSPGQYRERWGLAADYPMVAPNYAKHRSKLAKEIGLGTTKSRRRG